MNIDFYDAAVAEVRNKASDSERKALSENPEQWRDALMRVIDEMESQFGYREQTFDDQTSEMDHSSAEYQIALSDYQRWKLGARTFQKHIQTRLSTVNRLVGATMVAVDEFAEAVRRLRRFDDADNDVLDEGFEDAIIALYELLDRYDS